MYAYIRRRYWENQLLAGQIVGMIGMAFTSDGTKQPEKAQSPSRKGKRKTVERFLKGQGFEIK